MRPDVVTFWHGPLDALRLTCLRSQVAAGHKVTVYSFDPLAGLPDGVGNAEAEAILPHSFSERLRPPQPDGSWRDWTILQFSDFFRMRLMAEKAGLWLDADVLLLKPVEIDPAKPYFAWERPRQLGNSVLSAWRSDRAGVRKPDEAGRTDAGLAGAAPSPDLHAAATARRIEPPLGYSCRDLWSSRAHRARATIGELQHALPKQSFYAVHAEPRLFFEPSDFSALLADPEIIGLHISPKGRGGQQPIPGSLYAWAAECSAIKRLRLFPSLPLVGERRRAKRAG